MAWYWWYCLVSLAIGIISEVYEKLHPDPEKEPACLDSLVEKGHLQRETFGERDVYHPRDQEGHIQLELSEEEEKGNMLFLFVDIIIASILWPITLCEWIHVRFRSGTN